MTINTNNTTAACSGGDEPAVLCEHCDFFDMLWKWFEERRGSDDMRANHDGLSADDFKDMLDEHEASLLPDEAATAQASAPRSASAGDGVREALEHARARFECLAEDFKEADDTVSWAMCSVDAERMSRALASNPLEGEGIQSITEQASSGVRSPEHGEG